MSLFIKITFALIQIGRDDPTSFHQSLCYSQNALKWTERRFAKMLMYFNEFVIYLSFAGVSREPVGHASHRIKRAANCCGEKQRQSAQVTSIINQRVRLFFPTLRRSVHPD